MLKSHFDPHIADDQIPSRFQSGCEGNGGVVVAWKHLKYLDNWLAVLEKKYVFFKENWNGEEEFSATSICF